jgi:hypothetical protein
MVAGVIVIEAGVAVIVAVVAIESVVAGSVAVSFAVAPVIVWLSLLLSVLEW